VNNWKVILATVVIFGAGVVTGGLLVNHIFHSRSKPQRHPQDNVAVRASTNSLPAQNQAEVPMPRMAKEMGKQFVQKLNEKLKLTPEQLVKIEKIVLAGQDRNHEIWTNVAPKIHAVMQDVNQQIRAELTPEQLVSFEELLKHPPRKPPGTNSVPGL